MAKLIILSAGHTNVIGRDRGASNKNFIEGELTVEFRELVFIELKKLGLNPIKDSNNSSLKESINYFKKYFSKDSINIEYHFNSFNNSATGTEVIIPNNPSKLEKLIAKDLAEITSKILKIPLRKITGVITELESHHGKLGWMRPKGENIVPELCFISNDNNMESFQENKFLLAKEHAKIIYYYSIGKNKYTFEPKELIHNVKINETLFSIANYYKTSVFKIKSDNNLSNDHIYINQKLKIKN